MLCVVAILTMLYLLAVPYVLNTVHKSKLESAAWQLVSDMRLARQAAITTGKTTRIEFRETAGDYRIFLPEKTVKVRLPEGIVYAGNNFPLVQGVRKVSFTSTGAPSQGGTVIFKNKRGDKLYVIMTPATARIRVSRDPPAHWDQ